MDSSQDATPVAPEPSITVAEIAVPLPDANPVIAETNVENSEKSSDLLAEDKEEAMQLTTTAEADPTANPEEHMPTSMDSEMKSTEDNVVDLESEAHVATKEAAEELIPEIISLTNGDQLPVEEEDTEMKTGDELPPVVDDPSPPTATLDTSRTEAVLTSSLALIADYGISSDSDSDSESSSDSSSSSESEVQVVDTVSYRNTVNVISSADEDSDVEVVDSIEGAGDATKKRPKKIIKAKGEMSVDDLPPIEDLNISVPEHECLELGTVMSIVDQLVLVESKRGSIALDLDTVLFLDQGKRTLGRIFDVLGQINQPLYCVRFNSAEHIQEKEIVPGMKVYYNSERPEHTTVVVLPNLMRFKGSDASWDHDIEPPEGCLEYSDDEQERSARKARKAGHKAIPEDPNQQRTKRTHPSNQDRVRNPFARGGPRGRFGGNNNNSWRGQPQQQPQWPQSQPGYGTDYANHSWHTYYQQQPPPPFPQPMHMPPGPFYINPYAQGGPPGANGPPPGWNNNGNFYQNGGGRFKTEK